MLKSRFSVSKFKKCALVSMYSPAFISGRFTVVGSITNGPIGVAQAPKQETEVPSSYTATT